MEQGNYQKAIRTLLLRKKILAPILEVCSVYDDSENQTSEVTLSTK